MQKTNTRVKKESQISLADYIIQKCNNLISIYNTTDTSNIPMLINELVKVTYNYMFSCSIYK